MSKKGCLSSPMNEGFHKAKVNTRGSENNVINHNNCPYFSKPRDAGPDSIPEVFHTTVKGRGMRGDPGADAAVSSPMGRK